MIIAAPKRANRSRLGIELDGMFIYTFISNGRPPFVTDGVTKLFRRITNGCQFVSQKAFRIYVKWDTDNINQLKGIATPGGYTGLAMTIQVKCHCEGRTRPTKQSQSR